ncbi:MAG: hypothetical protein ACI4A5_00390 [Hominilimicola sp.]
MNNQHALYAEKSSDGILIIDASYETEKAKLLSIENHADITGVEIDYTDTTMTVGMNAEDPTEENENGIMIAALYDERGVCVQVIMVSANKAKFTQYKEYLIFRINYRPHEKRRKV